MQVTLTTAQAQAAEEKVAMQRQINSLKERLENGGNYPNFVTNQVFRRSSLHHPDTHVHTHAHAHAHAHSLTHARTHVHTSIHIHAHTLSQRICHTTYWRENRTRTDSTFRHSLHPTRRCCSNCKTWQHWDGCTRRSSTNSWRLSPRFTPRRTHANTTTRQQSKSCTKQISSSLFLFTAGAVVPLIGTTPPAATTIFAASIVSCLHTDACKFPVLYPRRLAHPARADHTVTSTPAHRHATALSICLHDHCIWKLQTSDTHRSCIHSTPTSQ